MPDEVFDGKKTITLGGTTLELIYLGPNHSDSNIVMRLPKEKIIFVVDTIPVGIVPGPRHDRLLSAGNRGLHQEGDRAGLGPPDPRPSRPAGGRLGTKKDAKNVLDAHTGSLGRDEEARPGRQMLGRGREGIQAAEVRELAGLCRTACRFVARRYCGLWGRGT